MLQRLPFGVRGVVFDLDGTLTVPCINFKDMRRRTGILEGDILKVMQTLPQDRKVHVARVIEELEEDGRQRMRLQPGLLRVMECLDIHKLPRALLTRNSDTSARHFVSVSGHTFNPMLTRTNFPVAKPDPTPLTHICHVWGTDPRNVVMVGDARDDVACAKEAGCMSCLLETNLEHPLSRNVCPDVTVSSLEELAEILRANSMHS